MQMFIFQVESKDYFKITKIYMHHEIPPVFFLLNRPLQLPISRMIFYSLYQENFMHQIFR